MVGIQVLPTSTARLLSSGQALHDPASIIKELLDNAIDASATLIEISIAANVVDHVEVRDNGHGIALGDLGLLGKRGCTSKIRTFGELRDIGRTSLGFRGEALASATFLGDVSIATRTEDEHVAKHTMLKTGGGIARQIQISHAVGTRVTIKNLFGRFPVRKEQFSQEKESKRQILRVKALLLSYGLARTHLRLRLKIFKSGKPDWVFAPGPANSAVHIVSQLVGRELASQCIEVNSACDGQQHTDAVLFQAVVPRVGSDWQKISRGCFLSIDSRPVSHARGTPKKIYGIFKASMCRAGAVGDKIKSPFLRLNIVCPPGSYDPNIEPAKDDVLFVEESELLEAAKVFFAGIYKLSSSSTQQETCLIGETQGDSSVSCNAGGNDSSLSPETQLPAFQTSGRVSSPLAAPVTLGRSVQPCLPRHLIDSSGPMADKQVSAGQVDRLLSVVSPIEPIDTSANQLNPWTIAKLTASTRAQPSKQPTRQDVYMPINNLISSRPIDCRAPSCDNVQQQPTTKTFLDLTDEVPPNESTHQQAYLKNWITNVPSRNLELNCSPHYDDPVVLDGGMLLSDGNSVANQPTNDLNQPRRSGRIQRTCPNPAYSEPSRLVSKRGINKPFVIPSRKQQPNVTPRLSLGQFEPPHLVTPPPSSPLHREGRQVQHTSLQPIRSSTTVAQASGQQTDDSNFVSALEITRPAETTLRDGDPRAYLLRRQNSLAVGPSNGPRMRRQKTIMLPFEKVPDQQKLQNLEQRLTLDLTRLSILQSGIAVFDVYPLCGNLACSWDGHIDIDVLRNKVRLAVENWAQQIPERADLEVVYDFCKINVL